jgi:AraC-like DNA-binding protein
LLRLKDHENRRTSCESLGRALSELERAWDGLRTDKRAQTAIASAIASVQLVLEHDLGAGPHVGLAYRETTRPTPASEAVRARRQGLPSGLLKRIDAYFLRCLERESPPRVSELARVLGLALGSFVETFHIAVGATPSSYLKDHQIETAAVLLRKTNLTIDKVGYAAGFGTRRTFFREFRLRMNTSPARYRNQRKDPRYV